VFGDPQVKENLTLVLLSVARSPAAVLVLPFVSAHLHFMCVHDEQITGMRFETPSNHGLSLHLLRTFQACVFSWKL